MTLVDGKKFTHAHWQIGHCFRHKGRSESNQPYKMINLSHHHHDHHHYHHPHHQCHYHQQWQPSSVHCKTKTLPPSFIPLCFSPPQSSSPRLIFSSRPLSALTPFFFSELPFRQFNESHTGGKRDPSVGTTKE